MTALNNPEFILDLEESANHILRQANKRRREASRVEKSVFSYITGKGDAKTSTKSTTAIAPEVKSTVISRPRTAMIGKKEVLSTVVSAPSTTLDPEAQRLANISNLRGAVMLAEVRQNKGEDISEVKGRYEGSLEARERGTEESAKPPPSRSSLARKPYVPPNEKVTETLSSFTANLNKKDVAAAALIAPAPDLSDVIPKGIFSLQKFRPATSSHKSLRKLQDSKRASSARRPGKIPDPGPTENTYHGLKKKYRSEPDREQKFMKWIQDRQEFTSFFDDGEVVERHPLLVNTIMIINRENYYSQDRSRRRLLARRFNLDVREIWLSNLRHITEMRAIKNAYTVLAMEQEEKDEQEFESRGDADANAELVRPWRDTKDGGLHRRRDSAAIGDMKVQIQSVSLPRALENAYHTTYQSDPKVILDYVSEPTPHLLPPPPLPPVLDSIVGGYVLQAVTAAVPKMKSSRAPSAAHVVAWSQKTEMVSEQLHNTVHPPEDADVMLFIDRLIPSFDQVPAATTQSDNGIFWRLIVLRRGDVMETVTIGKEIEIAEFVGGIWSSHSKDGGDDCSSDAMAVYEVADFSLVHSDFVPEFSQSFDSFCLDLPGSLDAHSSTIKSVDDVYQPPVSARRENSAADVYRAAITIDVVTKEGKAIPYCSAASSGNPGTFCRAQCTLDIEIRVRIADEDVELTVVTSPIELLQVLCIPIMPLSDVDWWTSPARGKDVWPLVCRSLKVTGNSTADLTLDFFRKPSSHIDRIEGALSACQAFAIAQELVSHVVVQFEEMGEPLSVFIPGAPTTMMTANKRRGSSKSNKSRLSAQFLNGQCWEDLAWSLPSLSLQINGGVPLSSQVPGASEFGKKGLWKKPPVRTPKEDTRVAGVFIRDPLLSTSNTILIMLTLAIDVSILFPPMIAWDSYSEVPPKAVSEEVMDLLPSLMMGAAAVLREKLISPLDRLSKTVTVLLAGLQVGYDHVPLDWPTKPAGMRRMLADMDEHGFRQLVEYSLLDVDPVSPTYIFGLTNLGATANEPGVNPRNIWRSNLAVLEFVNRELTPVDYHYIISAQGSQGLNDRFIHTIQLNGIEFIRLNHISSNSFDTHNREIQERRDIFNRQLALNDVIERGKIALKMNQKANLRDLERNLQRTFERKMNKASQTEKGWASRYLTSTVLDVKGFWEKRRDNRTGLVFFHRTAPVGAPGRLGAVVGNYDREKFKDTCQWQVPLEFCSNPDITDDDVNDFDSLASGSIYENAASPTRRNHHGGGGGGGGGGRGHIGFSDFDEPGETWLPEGHAPDRRTHGSNPRRDLHTNRGKTKKPMARGDNSVDGQKSFAESLGATIDTQNLEHLAEQLVSSDELMRALARRLGIPESKVVPASELDSVFSIDEASIVDDDPEAVLRAPRDAFNDEIAAPEVDSDDDLWSDDEVAPGDVNADEVGEVPTTQADVAAAKRQKWRETAGIAKGAIIPKSIPFLNFRDHAIGDQANELNLNVLGWKRLPRPEFNVKKFYEKLSVRRTQGPDPSRSNTLNFPIVLTRVAPSDGTQYVPESYTADYTEIFIPNASKDLERAVGFLERQMRTEKGMAEDIATDELLVNGEAKEETVLDAKIKKQRADAIATYVDPKLLAVEAAIQGCKSGNIAAVEDALEEEINIDTTDQFGNSLLLLATQQGSKRIVKFLLRRGAKINFQNNTGNTALHYCFAYHNDELGQYLIKRGASDIIQNVDGLTCYEGLNKDYIAVFDGHEDPDTESQQLLQWHA